MKVIRDDLVRLLAVHGAPCVPFESRPGIEYDDEQADKMGKRIVELDFMKELFRRIRTGDNTPVTLEDILSIRIEDDIMYPFALSAGDRILAHLCPKASSLKNKNELKGTTVNLNCEGYNGLRRTNGKYDIISSNHRSSRSIEDRANDDKVHRDNKFQFAIASAGHKCKDVNEAAKMMLFTRSSLIV
jgi:hypothetical protein